jgi:CHAD domain-containing protein
MTAATEIPPLADNSPVASAPLLDGAIFAGALRAYACAELDRAIAYLARRGGRVHAGVHQARKSLRRTRSVLALGLSVLGPGAALLDREVRRVNRQLSAMRDAQALVETLDRLIRKNKAPELGPVLRRARRIAAQARAESARAKLASDPGFARKRAMLTTLRAAMPALPWNALTENRLRDALDRGLARIGEARTRALSTGRDTDWHRWRRRVRRLSQQHRALGNLVEGLDIARKRCKSLAVGLGEAQDYALLRDHCGRRSIFSETDRHLLRALADDGTRRMRERVEQSIAEPSPARSE